jgi:photosystem II stability/assembly factor-like uncharacterized protein
MKKENTRLIEKLTTYLFYLSIVLFFISFNFKDNPPFGWYQQFMPNINGATIRDITFTDSLNGYAVTNIGGSNSYILKTTNGGDNWIVKFIHTQPFVRLEFINNNVGFTNAFQTIFKTTNAGENWVGINLPGIFGDDMYALNEDTIWLAMSESLTGGAFLTTDGGISWQVKYSQTSANPSHIYMYNARIGFIDANVLMKTTNGGNNWFSVTTGEGLFSQMYFIDSLTGWKSNQLMKKTTDGGITWINQPLPIGGNIVFNYMSRFFNVNKDTIWGVGGTYYIGGGQNRGMIFRTTNEGNNWYFQIPDTLIHIPIYYHTKFANNKIGWAYLDDGVHTLVGGDSSFIMSTQLISYNVPDKYRLEQNYPNPFNQISNIKYQISNIKSSNVIIKIFNITGKEIKTLLNKKQSPGEYEVKFDAGDLSSGIYFYTLFVDGVRVDTKKAVLIK